MQTVLFFLAAYLLGSIPFALLIGLAKGVDIREHGSGNVGATNAGRVLGKKWGITCFLLDVTKGFLPVLGYGLVVGTVLDSAVSALQWMAVAVAAVCGHVFPVWLRFKGGKGVATGLGVLLGFWPVLTFAGLAGALMWLIVLNATAYVGLASVLAAVSLPVWAVLAGLVWGVPVPALAVLVGLSTALAALVVVRHRSNIKNLLAGTESRVGWGIRGKKISARMRSSSPPPSP